MAETELEIVWHRLKVGIVGYELYANFIFPILLFAISLINLFCACMQSSALSWISVVIVDAYLFILILLASIKMPERLPERHVALVSIPALFLVLVMSFGTLYINDGNVFRALPNDSKDKLNAPSDAMYFSLVTLTTVGYGDYTPYDQKPRWLVVAELLSGALLLFFAFPVLGSRIAQYDAPNGTTIRRVKESLWEIQEKDAALPSYRHGKRLTVDFDETGRFVATPHED